MRTYTDKSIIREWFEIILIAFIVALIIQTFVLKPFKIPSGSMMDTLQIGDMIFVNRFAYWFTSPKQGDVVVFKYPENLKQDFIKRVVAVEKDTLDIREEGIYVNNRLLSEPYTREPTYDTGVLSYPYTIPGHYIFVMGDNRNNSKDSRFWGPLKKEYIKGKAFLVYWYNKNRKGEPVFWNPKTFFRIRFIR